MRNPNLRVYVHLSKKHFYSYVKNIISYDSQCARDSVLMADFKVKCFDGLWVTTLTRLPGVCQDPIQMRSLGRSRCVVVTSVASHGLPENRIRDGNPTRVIILDVRRVIRCL